MSKIDKLILLIIMIVIWFSTIPPTILIANSSVETQCFSVQSSGLEYKQLPENTKPLFERLSLIW